MRHEFEALRRLRTSETPPKRAPVAPRWGCDGGNAPDANTSCRRLARCANGRQRTAPQPGHTAEACMHATRSLHSGWGRRAPLRLHRRHRGGALEAHRRCLVDKFMAQVLDVRRCRRRQYSAAHCRPSPDCDTRRAWGSCAVTHPPGRGRLRPVTHGSNEVLALAADQRVRAPSNGTRLQHCRW